MQWLLEHGADVSCVDKAGFTPLAWACRSGIFPLVRVLVDAGADVMHRRPELPGGRWCPTIPTAQGFAVVSSSLCDCLRWREARGTKKSIAMAPSRVASLVVMGNPRPVLDG